MSAPRRLVVLISGRGSNMEALLNAKLPAVIAAVISNRPDARGLATAQAHGVPTAILDHQSFASRDAFDAALAEEIDKHRPDLIVLAGFMRVLGAAFIQRFYGRLINIHPSLLPALPGLNTHRRALEAGVRIHGCTVHFVSAEVDAGPIVAQAAVAVQPTDTEQTLAARVLEQEHRIFPAAIRALCEERVVLDASGRVVGPGNLPPPPALLAPAFDLG